jgi:hypothetical protein
MGIWRLSRTFRRKKAAGCGVFGYEAVAGYEGFIDAYDTALGIGGTGPVDPGADEIAATTVEPQRSMLTDFADDLLSDGEAFRGRPDRHDPWAVSANEGDQRVVVYDCVTVGAYDRVDESRTEPSSINDDAETRRLDAAGVVREGSGWKVGGVSIISEGLEECTSSAR